MKTLHSVRIEDEVWKNARLVFKNISKEIENHLRGFTKNSADLIHNFSYCKLCKQHKQIENMYKIDDPAEEFKDSKGNILCVIYFVCKECLLNVKQGKTNNYDKEIVKFVSHALEGFENNIKENKKPETIERVRRREISFYKEFADYIGLYDSSDEEVHWNSIKALIQEIEVGTPLANWMIGKGECKILLKERYKEIYKEE